MHFFVRGIKQFLLATLLVSSTMPKQYAATPTANSSNMVTASISTVAWRLASLEKTVQSLLPQVNRLNVFLQWYKSVPAFLNHPKITVAVGELYPNILALGDGAKFFWADKTRGYHFIADDDILYPSNYVAYCIEKIEQYQRKAVIGFQGCVLKEKMHSLRDRIVYSFGESQDHDIPVHILGTGVLAYHTDTIKIKMEDFLKKNMADIWFGIVAQKQQIPLICVQRPAAYLMALPESHGPESICRQKNGHIERFNVIQKYGPWKLQEYRATQFFKN